MSNLYRNGSFAAADPLREQRAAMLLMVRCSVLGGAFFNIRVRNLSSQGLGGTCLQSVSLREQQPVIIAFRNVSPIEAQVMWFQGGEVGVRFDAPVDIDRISEARSWTGPEFTVQAHHEKAERCYRPGVLRSGLR
jgi:hypothetical protein